MLSFAQTFQSPFLVKTILVDGCKSNFPFCHCFDRMECNGREKRSKSIWNQNTEFPSLEPFEDLYFCANNHTLWATAIALLFRLRLSSCSPGFESQVHLRFFQFVLLKFEWGQGENKRKRDREWPIFLKTMKLPDIGLNVTWVCSIELEVSLWQKYLCSDCCCCCTRAFNNSPTVTPCL